MSEPNAEAVIKAAQSRTRKPAESVNEVPAIQAPNPLPAIVANPFTDETGNSLADSGQRVN